MSLSELYMPIRSDLWTLPVNFLRQSVLRDYPTHFHEYPEFLLFRSGSCRATTGGRAYTVRQGDVVMTEPNGLHSLTYTGSECAFYCLLIKPSYMNALGLSHKSFSGFFHADEETVRRFENIEAAFFSDNPSRACRVTGETDLLLASLIDRGYSAPFSPAGPKGEAQVKETIQYITEHFSEKLTTADLAASAYLNESYFCRLFKSYTGQSPLAYLNRHRAEYAAQLLRETDDTVIRIAMSTGFSDVTYFARVFYAFFGLTPSEYRNKERIRKSGRIT